MVAANDGTGGAAVAAFKAAGVDPVPPVTGNDADTTLFGTPTQLFTPAVVTSTNLKAEIIDKKSQRSADPNARAAVQRPLCCRLDKARHRYLIGAPLRFPSQAGRSCCAVACDASQHFEERARVYD